MTGRLGLVVTGAAGFLGRHLIPVLLAHGYPIAALTGRSRCVDGARYVDKNLLWFESLDDSRFKLFVDNNGVKTVIHAAACYDHNENTDSILESNLLLPLRLFRSLNCGSGLDGFINIGTSIPPKTNKYALSKFQWLMWMDYLSQSVTVPLVNLNTHYLYGAGDVSHKFSSSIISACKEKAKVFEMSAGTQIRDFIYITDAVSAILSVLKALGNNINSGFQNIDIGTGYGTSLLGFAREAIRVSGSNLVLKVGARAERQGEPKDLRADVSSLRELGWRQTIDLASGLRLIFEERQ